MAAFVRSLGIALVLLFCAQRGQAAPAGGSCPAPSQGAGAVQMFHGLPLVTATVNGAAAPLILDTGAEETVLTAAAAARLGLKGHYAYPHSLRSVSGGVATGQARIESLSVGDSAVRNFFVLVGSLTLPSAAGAQPAGLLGGDFLSHFDVDLDLAEGRLALYPPGCGPARPPWRSAYTTIPANLSIDDRLFFPVALDGHKLFAFIDTGAQVSTIDTAAAARLGLSKAEISGDPAARLRGVSAAPMEAHAHRFAWLRIGGDTVRDPVLIVTALNLPDADIVLGLDFLRGRRVWFSYLTHRIFLARPEAR
ncbi:MAG: aspartyl protease family protein [Stellaceae bacterium]